MIPSRSLSVVCRADSTTTNAGDTLSELSTELTKVHQHSMRSNKGELDFVDLNWVPDPVDAAPDYRKSKSADVIDSLVACSIRKRHL